MLFSSVLQFVISYCVKFILQLVIRKNTTRQMIVKWCLQFDFLDSLDEDELLSI
ncbi:hypothetical protein HMPREF9999_02139 [Alloprevotella sp. oral taxon 473 str. F0040]|nr:hypothetical protein HMPREF9999_02139 [Alloprevotella sp. oral taxon 473 str. F0040]